jgi:rhamnose utilization protein RhaD (predicted bifunctional aldolase and dehydrogenase)
MNTIDSLIELARTDADGAVSTKTETTLVITAAGTTMTECDPSRFLEIPRTILSEVVDDTEKSMNPVRSLLAEWSDGDGRLPPGRETFFHNAIPHQYLLLARTPIVSGLVASDRGRDLVESHFGDTAIFVTLGSAKETIDELHREIDSFFDRTGSVPKVAFFENHGAIFGGDSVEEIAETKRSTIERLESVVERGVEDEPMQNDSDDLVGLNDAVRRALADTWAAHGTALSPPVSTACRNPEILRRAASREAFVTIEHPLLTEHLSHLGRALCFVERHGTLTSPQALLADVLHEIHDFHHEWDAAPRIVVIQNAGAVVIGDDDEELTETCRAFRHLIAVATYAEQFGGVRSVPAGYIAALG